MVFQEFPECAEFQVVCDKQDVYRNIAFDCCRIALVQVFDRQSLERLLIEWKFHERRAEFPVVPATQGQQQIDVLGGSRKTMKHHGGSANNGVFDTVIVQRFHERAEIIRGR